MKRVGHLFDNLVSWQNLLLAARRARRGKRFRPNVARFEYELEMELLRLREERMIAGVCGGLGRRLAIDASMVRIIWAFLALLSWGVGAIAYAVTAAIVPEESLEADSQTGDPDTAIPEKIDPASRPPGGSEAGPAGGSEAGSEDGNTGKDT